MCLFKYAMGRREIRGENTNAGATRVAGRVLLQDVALEDGDGHHFLLGIHVNFHRAV